jgi:hypothetical protein
MTTQTTHHELCDCTKGPKPVRGGERWLEAERQHVLDQYGRGVDLTDIAAAHGRTVLAIKAQLLRFGISFPDVILDRSGDLWSYEPRTETALWFRDGGRPQPMFVSKDQWEGKLRGMWRTMNDRAIQAGF